MPKKTTLNGSAEGKPKGIKDVLQEAERGREAVDTVHGGTTLRILGGVKVLIVPTRRITNPCCKTQ